MTTSGVVGNKVNSVQTAPFQHIWPLNLGTMGEEPYAMFEIYTSVNAPNGQPQFIGSLGLPLPDNIVDDLTAEYTSHSFWWDRMQSFVDSWKSSGLMNTAGGAEAMIGGIYQQLGGEKWFPIKSDEVEAMVSRKIGKVVNPHMAVLFKSIHLRVFQFKWTMYAKSAKESEAIKKIVEAFRYHASPEIRESEAARWMHFPENFKIQLVSGGSLPGSPGSAIFKIGLCSLKNVTVTYNGEHAPTFFKNTGEPVLINLQLTFEEHELITKDRIKEGY